MAKIIFQQKLDKPTSSYLRMLISRSESEMELEEMIVEVRSLYEETTAGFIDYFMQLTKIHQRNGEDVSSYMLRFNDLAEKIRPQLSDHTLSGAYIQGLSSQIRRNIKYKDQLFKEVLKMSLMEEFKLKKIALEDKITSKPYI